MNWLLGKIVGNPAVLLAIVLAAFLAAFLAGGSAAWTVQGWRLDAVQAEFETYRTQVAALGRAAEVEKTRIEAEHARTTKEIRDAIPKQIATARTNAVRNYVARVPAPTGSSCMPGTPNGAGGVDAAGKEPVAAGWSGTAAPAFIEDCAQDAAVVSAWQAWARGIGFPVK